MPMTSACDTGRSVKGEGRFTAYAKNAMPGGNLEVGKTGHRANEAWFTAVVEGEEQVHAAIGKIR